jgi:acetyltransferase-like isoleucine patch superfamily enzyme
MEAGARLEKAALLTNPHRVFLGKKTAITHSSRIEAITEYRGLEYAGRIIIGDGTSIQPYAHIAAACEMTIGRDVLIGSHVFISDHDHQFHDVTTPIGDQPLLVRPVCIEDRVWLGEHVAVLKGVTIGHHAVIGANSVVTRDIPPYAIAVGAPARVVRLWTPA